MSQPYVGEIRMFAGNFPPAGWMFCDGTVLSIAANDVLFTLIGTTYGGDGQNTFALPDLRGRVPVHQGPGHPVGESLGQESVTLASATMPAHNHALIASTALASATAGPTGVLASSATMAFYGVGAPSMAMAATALSAAGAGQSHENMAPFVAVSFIISLFGIFPSQA